MAVATITRQGCVVSLRAMIIDSWITIARNGVELTGGSFARVQAVAAFFNIMKDTRPDPNDPNIAIPVARIINSSAIVFPVPTQNLADGDEIVVMDSQIGGEKVLSTTLDNDPPAPSVDDTIQIPINGFNYTLDATEL